MDEEKVIKTKRIAKNSVLLYVRLFFAMLLGLYTSRVALDVLGVQDFGIYNLVGGLIIVLSFVCNSMTLAVNRFLAFNIGLGNDDGTNEVFSMAVNIHALIALVVIFLGETVGLWFINTQLVFPVEKIFAANLIYQSSIFSFALTIIGTPYSSDIMAHEKMGVYAFIGIIQSVMKFVAAFALYFVSSDKLVVYALLMTTPAIISFCINYFYAKRNFIESSYKWTWSKSLFIEMSKFAGLSTFGNMATAVVNQGQSILLNIFYGPALNAVRGLAMQVNSAMSTFANGIYTAVNPQIIKSYAQNDKDYFKQLVFNSTTFAYYLLFTIVLPVFLEINPILSIWLKNVPEYTVAFVRLILINSLVYNFVTPTWMALQATGHIARIHLVTGSINLMNLLITYVLWKLYRFEPYTIIIVNVLVSAVMQVASIIIQRQQLSINIVVYFKEVLLKVIISTIVAVIIPLFVYLNMEEGFLRFFIIFFVSIICCFTSFYFIGISSNVRAFLRRTFINILVKKTFIQI